METAGLRLQQEGDDRRRHHAVIAGTGRAGTTFLVQFLKECGLETSRQNELAYFPRARAGLEHSLLSTDPLPYVVKDAWLWTYCQAVDLDALAIDALIIPMRDLLAAATSRILQERIGVVETDRRHFPLSSVHAVTPGGAIFSLDAMDQARVLAVGFHELLFWAVRSGIPLFLLEFPRLVEDDRYLVQTLWPWLGTLCDEARAFDAFRAVADPGRVRVMEGEGIGSSSVPSHSALHANLDRAAMVALLDELSAQLARSRENLSVAREDTSSADF